MKFVDEVRIFVKAGDGGNGAVAFRREKYVERGGPNGGDGGNGGSVVFVADPQLTTLLDFRYQQHHRAKDGQQGMGNDCNGRGSDDLILRVPVGTLVKDADTGETVADLSVAEERFVAAQGGRGGLGNMNFATSTRQAPRFAQDGTRGQERTLLLELKLLADVGLLGFPNAGKSTLIARVSRARPKIADYPFTTLAPNLGLVRYRDERSFVMADIPGLIEGASEGAGLGHQFLRHVERCRVLIHLIDLSAPGEGRAPIKDWEILNRELQRYSPLLAGKPQVVAASKMDLPDAQERLKDFTAAMKKRGHMVYPFSAVTGEGVQALMDAAVAVLDGRSPASKSADDGLKLKHRPRAAQKPAAAVASKNSAKSSAKAKAKPIAKSPSKSAGKSAAAPKSKAGRISKRKPEAPRKKPSAKKPKGARRG
jgi:GTP-binding protein